MPGVLQANALVTINPPFQQFFPGQYQVVDQNPSGDWDVLVDPDTGTVTTFAAIYVTVVG